jgi:hypothetical protein
MNQEDVPPIAVLFAVSAGGLMMMAYSAFSLPTFAVSSIALAALVGYGVWNMAEHAETSE